MIMRSFKQSWIFPAVIITAFSFLLIQFIVFNYMVNSTSVDVDPNQEFEYQEKFVQKHEGQNEHLQKNAKLVFQVRGRTLTMPAFSSITTTAYQTYKINKIKKIDIPLDYKKRPSLNQCLPFFDIYNLKFKMIDVEGLVRSNGISDDSFIRGVNPEKKDLYKSEHGLFNCVDSNQKIPYANLNDDFCDCVDGSDEPGTSACQYSKFYCTRQDQLLKNNFVESMKVDDGICDCCDGSDEKDTKCPNRCQKLLNIAKKELEKSKQGLFRKQDYLNSGRGKSESQYGPGGVFFQLSNTCYKIDWSEYTFEVCPFSKVLQMKKKSRHSLTNLGHISSLELIGSIWRLKISGGDPSNCSQPRQSEIYFKCGLKDELLSVEEPQKCLYKFKMSSPAAC